MNQFERLKNTLARTPFMGRGVNSVMEMQSFYQSTGTEVTQRTIRRDFALLETTDDVTCTDTDGKWRLFSRPKKSGSQVITELAFVMCLLENELRSRFPSKVVNALEEQFALSREVIRKVAHCNPNDRLVRFMKLTRTIDFSKHLTLNHIRADVLQSLIDAVYEGKELSFALRGEEAQRVITAIQLKELDNTLYLQGLELNGNESFIRLDTSKIAYAKAVNYSYFQLKAAA
jgi:predicted DNA-binding transcriptional regulator YafY